MTSTLKLYGGIALVIVLGLMVWGVINWDNNRLAAQFTAGEQAERALWTAKQTDATNLAVLKGNSDTLTSERVADASRTEASATTAASSAVSHTTVEKIRYAYVTAPAVACIPTALPVGVLEGLSEARSAALGQAAAGTGGLQPAQRR